MSAADDGIDVMRARMSRGQRTPPAPPRTATRSTAQGGSGSTPPVALEDSESDTRDAPRTESATAEATAVPPQRTTERSRRVTLRPGDPHVNLAIRVRRPLDDQLVDVLHRLRRADIRSSKVELIEMLLWEMPVDLRNLRTRLAAFREAAPRSGDAIT